MGSSLSIEWSDDPSWLAQSIFNGPGVSVANAAFLTHAAFSSGPFSFGPFGIGSGGLLTTGRAWGAYPEPIFADVHVFNGAGSSIYCPQSSGYFDASVLSVDIDIAPGYEGVLVEFILASSEYLDTNRRPDAIGIFLDEVQYAVDNNGDRITAISEYLSPEIAIVPPDSETSYDGSSPPLIMGIPAAPGRHTMVFAVCDAVDEDWDSGMFVKAQGCISCDPQIKINYVTSTTTTGSTTFTSTIKASGTESGTVMIGVATSATTSSETPETSTTSSTSTSVSSTSSVPSTTSSSSATSTSSSPSLSSTTSISSVTTVSSVTLGSTTTSTFSIVPRSTTTSGTNIVEEEGETTLTQTSTTPSSTSKLTSAHASATVKSSSASSTPGNSITSLLDTTILPEVESTTTSFSSRSSTSTQLVSDSTQSTHSPVSPATLSTSSEMLPVTSISTTLTDDNPSVESAAAFNQPSISGYTFDGCFGSDDGYPTFTLIVGRDFMTPAFCISQAQGSPFIGVYDRFCYAAKSLSSARRVTTDQCSLRCPGDSRLFCGGLAGSSFQPRQISKRQLSANILLTIYSAEEGAVDPPESTTSSLDEASTTASELTAGSESTEQPPELPSTLSRVIPEKLKPPMMIIFTNYVTQVVVGPAKTEGPVVHPTANHEGVTIPIPVDYHVTMDGHQCDECIASQPPIITISRAVVPCEACENGGDGSLVPTAPAVALPFGPQSCPSGFEEGSILGTTGQVQHQQPAVVVQQSQTGHPVAAPGDMRYGVPSYRGPNQPAPHPSSYRSPNQGSNKIPQDNVPDVYQQRSTDVDPTTIKTGAPVVPASSKQVSDIYTKAQAPVPASSMVIPHPIVVTASSIRNVVFDVLLSTSLLMFTVLYVL